MRLPLTIALLLASAAAASPALSQDAVVRIEEGQFKAGAGRISFSKVGVGAVNPVYPPGLYGGGADSPTVRFAGYFRGRYIAPPPNARPARRAPAASAARPARRCAWTWTRRRPGSWPTAARPPAPAPASAARRPGTARSPSISTATWPPSASMAATSTPPAAPRSPSMTARAGCWAAPPTAAPASSSSAWPPATSARASPGWNSTWSATSRPASASRPRSTCPACAPRRHRRARPAAPHPALMPTTPMPILGA